MALICGGCLKAAEAALAEGRADVDLAIREHVITAVVPFDEAPELLTGLAERRRHEVQAVLAV